MHPAAPFILNGDKWNADRGARRSLPFYASSSFQIVALNSAQYDGGSHCFETITITANGKTAQATIMDEVGFHCSFRISLAHETKSKYLVPGMPLRWLGLLHRSFRPLRRPLRGRAHRRMELRRLKRPRTFHNTHNHPHNPSHHFYALLDAHHPHDDAHLDPDDYFPLVHFY